MAIDLAHYSRRTKDDVLDVVTKYGKGCVASTHGIPFASNNPSLQERAFEEAQIREILSLGGLIGPSVCKPFVTSIEEFVGELI
mgnify:CR=1 FL=1